MNKLIRYSKSDFTYTEDELINKLDDLLRDIDNFVYKNME